MVSIVHRSVEIPVTPWIQMDPPQLDEANESPSSCWLDAPGVLVPTGYSSQRAGNTPGINHPNRPWLDCRVLHRCRTAFAHWMAVGRKGRITSRLWPLLKQTSISWVPLWHERVEKKCQKKGWNTWNVSQQTLEKDPSRISSWRHITDMISTFPAPRVRPKIAAAHETIKGFCTLKAT